MTIRRGILSAGLLASVAVGAPLALAPEAPTSRPLPTAPARWSAPTEGDGSSSTAPWPGLWGPHRNAVVEEGLPWSPGTRLREIWRRPLGQGYGEVAVGPHRGYAFYEREGEDRLEAFSLADGTPLWVRTLGPTYPGHDGSRDGPIATPVWADGRVFALDAHGVLRAFRAADGEPLWQRSLPRDFGTLPPHWGFAATPLPVDHRLVVQVGAGSDHHLVALDAASGELLWTTAPAREAGYSSPVLMELGGVRQIVAAAPDGVFAVDPEDGRLLWRRDGLGEPRQSPVALPGDRLFLTCWDESAVLRVRRGTEGWTVEELWRKPLLKGTYSPTVPYGGHLYGTHGDYLMAVDLDTGDEVWRHEVDDATLIRVGGHLVVLSEKAGWLRLVEASPDGYRELLGYPAFSPEARNDTGPSYFEGHFLLRNGEQMVLLALEPGQPAEVAQPGAPGEPGGAPPKP